MTTRIALLLGVTAGALLGQPASDETIGLLRSPAAAVRSMSYDMTLTLPRGPQGPSIPMVLTILHTKCRIEGDTAEIRLVDLDGPTGMDWEWMIEFLVIRVSPQKAEVLTQRGKPITTITRAGIEGDQEDGIGRHSTLGMLLLSVADSLDPSRLTWTPGATQPTGEVLYEAHAPEGTAGATQTWRFWFDPAKGYVTRVVALGLDGTTIAETVYAMPDRTPQGKLVPLQATTSVPAGVHIERATIGGQVHEVRFPREAQTAVTTFEWSEEKQVRLPIRREVTDAQGKPVCTLEFSNYSF
jgi:hypothetical protein